MAGCLPLLIQFPILIALFEDCRLSHQSEHYNFGSTTLARRIHWDSSSGFSRISYFAQQYVSSPNASDSTKNSALCNAYFIWFYQVFSCRRLLLDCFQRFRSFNKCILTKKLDRRR